MQTNVARNILSVKCRHIAFANPYEENAPSYEPRIGDAEEVDEAARIVDYTGNRIVLKSFAAG